MKRIFIVCICSLFVFSGCGKEDIPAHSDSEDVSTMSDSVQITEELPQEDTAVKTFTDADIEKALGNLQKGTNEFKPGYASYLSSLQAIPYEDSVYIRHGTVLHLYINTDPDGHASLCAGVEYSGKSWTFFDELLFLADDDVFTVKVNRNDKTEKPGSYVHEKYPTMMLLCLISWSPVRNGSFGFKEKIITLYMNSKMKTFKQSLTSLMPTRH